MSFCENTGYLDHTGKQEQLCVVFVLHIYIYLSFLFIAKRIYSLDNPSARLALLET